MFNVRVLWKTSVLFLNHMGNHLSGEWIFLVVFFLEEAGAWEGGKWRDNCYAWIKNSQKTPCPFTCDFTAPAVSWSRKHVRQYFYWPKFEEAALVFSVWAGCDRREWGYLYIFFIMTVQCLLFDWCLRAKSPDEYKVRLFVDVKK